MTLIPCPLTLAQANDYVAKNHRHHGPVVGYRFAIGAMDGGRLVGVAIVGRPVSRVLDDGLTVEVTRLCTDGTANACSFLYASCARAAKAMGYRKIITYILETETGASLKATGWKNEGLCGGRSWKSPSRHREDKSPICMKQRFALTFEAAESAGREDDRQ